MEIKDLPKISLKALKVFLKTYEAQSPTMVELKEDLGKVVTVLQCGDSDGLVECNSYITIKYSISPNIAFKYNCSCHVNSVGNQNLTSAVFIAGVYCFLY